MIEFQLNGQTVSTDQDPETPLLWVVRDHFKLKGSKFGCGAGLCGACTMHVDGRATRSCVLPIQAIKGAEVTTIEGLTQGGEFADLQQSWDELGVPQCGYCQSGQIMSAAALLAANAHPSEDDIVRAMDGNVCRCGAYPRIKQAIQSTVEKRANAVKVHDVTGSVES